MTGFVASGAAVLALAGCGSAAAGQPAAGLRLTAAVKDGGKGVVDGSFLREGGPISPGGQQPADQPLAGTIRFSRGRHQRIYVHVGKSGRFKATLPAGTFAVSGRSPSIEEQLPSGKLREIWCSRPLSVKVRAGRRERITVTCLVP
jgi:hypothetical protein